MKFFRCALLFTLILASTAAALAQKSECPLKQAPTFRGFSLGMTMLEVRGMLEDTTLFDINSPTRPSGSHAVRISAAELKEKFAEGIDEINLAFVDGKLAMLKVTYNSAMTWENGQDFLTKESERLGLPKPVATNTTGSRGNEKYSFECKGFAVTLAYSFGVSPNVTINDMAAQKLADERKKNEDVDVRRINIGSPRNGRP